MSDRPTPETDARTYVPSLGASTVPAEFARQLERERDEARAVAYDLAVIASHCLGWHDHESTDAAIRIAAALKRWKKSK